MLRYVTSIYTFHATPGAIVRQSEWKTSPGNAHARPDYKIEVSSPSPPPRTIFVQLLDDEALVGQEQLVGQSVVSLIGCCCSSWILAATCVCDQVRPRTLIREGRMWGWKPVNQSRVLPDLGARRGGQRLMQRDPAPRHEVGCDGTSIWRRVMLAYEL